MVNRVPTLPAAKMVIDCASTAAVSNSGEQTSIANSSSRSAAVEVTGDLSRCPRQAPTAVPECLRSSVKPESPDSQGAVVSRNNVPRMSLCHEDFFKVRMPNGEHVHLLAQYTISATENGDDAVVVLDDPGDDLSRLIRDFSNQV
ncbi:conserved hypothetical protein [Neospora caninum Liverpool]|uniref:Uncharacterized protein n=1 Tax=Neospora caninum (strain Liverpool) TaxID=572307 RepID=F0VDT4_NEOCL|nr:conserved hypothetical protein [Neospora caninum Liverpool]CBZ51877.1 conserved hypothetical protein [Neospora caninum Liverpool]CEL65837.1 TPA: hypothetical protein BN1204_016690 [Neospora caninum Liverpool]|eukprot:XP_003881910.1 conserved hypothetical protein [Neospora caninum Liverpool]